MKLNIEERVLHFKQPAGTSRGVYTTRRIWLITAMDEEGRVTGIGECAPLPQLSCDDIPDYAEVLRAFCDEVERTGAIPYEALRPYPSMLFGLESIKPTPNPSRGEGGLNTHAVDGIVSNANRTPLPSGDWGLQSSHRCGCGPTKGSKYPIRDGGLVGGGFCIPINGLVWMGTFEEMHQRIEEKLAAGFHCVKLKIGAIDWDREIALIRFIRERYSREQIELRVDANGGFTVDQAMSRLEELAKYDIHSIEQPIRQHQWSDMASLCQHSPLPIALDEELIGVNDPDEKVRLLDTIRPQYIILKPSLHGGLRGSEEWIRLARERGIGSWITSALESNVGLYAIARFTQKVYGPDITMPQGLGTGQLFTDNIELPDVEMRIEKGRLVVAPCSHLRPFLDEWNSPSPFVKVKTSGSTGAPKEMLVEKRRMLASARMTCDFMRLKPGDTALLCMSLDYIAGKMMVVRALERGLRLISVEPSGHPLANSQFSLFNSQFSFAAMVPMQVWNSLQVPEERERLLHVKHLLIGGGAISEPLAEELKDFPNYVWSSYGMTETLSHIALRRLNGPERSDWYTPLPGISVSLNDEGCLVIQAPHLCDEPLVTNDLAEMQKPRPDSPFRILGRRDNVICSSGIKMQMETIEEKLRPAMNGIPFMITKAKDEKFGEVVVLMVEPSAVALPNEEELFAALTKYERPKRIVRVERLPLTETGKPARAVAARLAEGE